MRKSVSACTSDISEALSRSSVDTCNSHVIANSTIISQSEPEEYAPELQMQKYNYKREELQKLITETDETITEATRAIYSKEFVSTWQHIEQERLLLISSKCNHR